MFSWILTNLLNCRHNKLPYHFLSCTLLCLYCICKFCTNALGSFCHGISKLSAQSGTVQSLEGDDMVVDACGKDEVEAANGEENETTGEHTMPTQQV